jgi:putative sterol carrier protein
VRFLSPAWFDAVQAALAASDAVRDATRDSTLRLLQVVTGGPDGDVSYLVTAKRGAVRIAPEQPHVSADVTLAATWDTAVAIATGALAPHDAFTTGRLVVRGDIDVLRAQAPALAGLSHAFDEVRAETTY